MKKAGRVLIAGINGFVGTHLNLKLSNLGYTVVGLSRKSPVDHSKSQLNICLEELEAKETEPFDYVVNVAGTVDHSPFRHKGNQILDDHFRCFWRLVAATCTERLRRFVQVGTGDEYAPSNQPVNENFPCSPSTIYSLSKSWATQLSQHLYATEKIPITVIRPFLIYGPKMNRARFIPQIIQDASSNRAIRINNPRFIRDFLYVDDFVEGVIATFEKDSVSGEIFNLASGQGVQLASVAEEVINIVGHGRIEQIENQNINNTRSILIGDITKAKGFWVGSLR